jgi:Domain of unknown function (DUF6431)
MSRDRLPPDPEACLVRLRSSTQKGGTLIAEDVTDWAMHDRRICDPDGYRPPFCPTCGERRLHVHDYRERMLRAEPDMPVVTIVRHACVACQAIWQVLPALIARHLWRTWPVVAPTLTPETPPAPAEPWRRPTVPLRTARRWRARWQRSAQALAQILTASGEAAWAALAGLLPAAATCGDVVAAYARQHRSRVDQAVAAVAALIYRLQPRVRLM